MRSPRKHFSEKFDSPEKYQPKKNTGKRKIQIKKQKPVDEKIRLNRYIANAGICSRREADKYITAGTVTVNGKVINEMGYKVLPTDDVRFNGQRLKPEKKVYLLLNKPKDTVTTVTDPHATKTVVGLVSNCCKERVVPMGRLDRNTTGVLLLTNDGDLTKKLTHPSQEIEKIYMAVLDKNFKSSQFEALINGVELDDGEISFDAVSYVEEKTKNKIIIRIHSGRNRIVRRTMEALGYKVKNLDRINFAGITKKGLRRGQWRFLTTKEVGYLKML
ncbi:MAG: rRNA pseudouridine synthase [Candidatus Zixiibacteriota bacterium]|nr:MAG: rRNA pseudouridine synthase [candidate division Zixibacteria bacterium]